MPKARFTLSDVAAMTREVRERCGAWRVNQVYDGDGRSFVVKLQQAGEAEKRLLLIESGTKFLVTRYDARDAPGEMPSPLCTKLRKELKGKVLADVRALGVDRVVAFRFGAGPGARHVVLELYAAGNVVLADENYVVLAALRSHATFGDGAELNVGEAYPVASAAAGLGTTEATLAETPAGDAALLKTFLEAQRDARAARAATPTSASPRGKANSSTVGLSCQRLGVLVWARSAGHARWPAEICLLAVEDLEKNYPAKGAGSKHELSMVLYFGETQFDMLPPDALEPFDVAEPKKHSSNTPGMKKAIDLAVARAEELHINLDE
mmetsp:Transcript_32728/g.101305  ORF Transcript_32728/g.101305 Transcript_32728/m.101305 type:complete len:323 (-) Transcript_32728:36-1004(-)